MDWNIIKKKKRQILSLKTFVDLTFSNKGKGATSLVFYSDIDEWMLLSSKTGMFLFYLPPALAMQLFVQRQTKSHVLDNKFFMCIFPEKNTKNYTFLKNISMNVKTNVFLFAYALVFRQFSKGQILKLLVDNFQNFFFIKNKNKINGVFRYAKVLNIRLRGGALNVCIRCCFTVDPFQCD